jgi:hypothetical protein
VSRGKSAVAGAAVVMLSVLLPAGALAQQPDAQPYRNSTEHYEALKSAANPHMMPFDRLPDWTGV